MKSKTGKLIKSVWLAAAAFLMVGGLPGTGVAKSYARIRVDAINSRPAGMHVAKDETLNGDIVASGVVNVEGTVNGDCVALGGPVSVSGDVEGDVASLGGPVEISGKVRGDVASLGGNVTLDAQAVVLGDVALLGGKLDKAPGASIKGNVTAMDLGLAKRFLPLMSIHQYRGASYSDTGDDLIDSLLGYSAFLFLLGGIGLMVALLAVFLPKQVGNAAEAIKADFWKSAGIGLLIVIFTLPGFLLMIISILGIPIVPIAMLLYCVAVLMGLAAFGVVLAERLYTALKKPLPGMFGRIMAGYLLLIGLSMLGKLLKLTGSMGGLLGGVFSFANFILVFCGLLVGLGAMWTTRMGSRQNGTN